MIKIRWLDKKTVNEFGLNAQIILYAYSQALPQMIVVSMQRWCESLSLFLKIWAHADVVSLACVFELLPQLRSNLMLWALHVSSSFFLTRSPIVWLMITTFFNDFSLQLDIESARATAPTSPMLASKEMLSQMLVSKECSSFSFGRQPLLITDKRDNNPASQKE